MNKNVIALEMDDIVDHNNNAMWIEENEEKSERKLVGFTLAFNQLRASPLSRHDNECKNQKL